MRSHADGRRFAYAARSWPGARVLVVSTPWLGASLRLGQSKFGNYFRKI